MYKSSFSLKNRKEHDVLALVHFIRFENVKEKIIPILGNQLWTVALNDLTTASKLRKIEFVELKY